MRGYNLAERLDLKSSGAASDTQNTAREKPTTKGREHLDAWRSQTPFDQDRWWEERLALDGLSEAELARLSDSDAFFENADLFGERSDLESPRWKLALTDAFATAGETANREGFPSEAGLFAPILAPLTGRAFYQVERKAEEALEGGTAKPFDPTTVTRLLYKGLPSRLDKILGRTLVLEMFVARAHGALAGETSRQRFESFVAGFEDVDRIFELFREYPVLARLVVQTVEQWRATSEELLERLATDWELIRSTFSPDHDPGPLVSVSGGLGDLHKDGRSVRMLGFESGFQLVYKPRTLAIDAQFGRLLDWLNERRELDLNSVRVLDRKTHGWAEVASSRACDDQAAVGRFYQRQGAFLALLYALGANDMHRENLVAVGEYPVLIDLETLFSPDYGRSNPDHYESAAEYALDNSLMRIMLLPYFNRGADHGIVESSGLGGEEGQQAVHDSLQWENPGTDQMRLVRRKGRLQQAHNRPSLDGENIDPFVFVEDLERGFVEMYDWLREHRDELLAEDSPLEGFRTVEVRSVLRASQFYGFILRESYHPDLLRDAIDRDRHLDRIWFGMDRSRLADLSRRLIPAERRDLWRGDLPYFTTRADSRDLFTSDGQRLEDFFSRSGFEVMRDHLERLSDRDRDEQRWYLRGSLTALAMSTTAHWGRYELPAAAPEPATPERLVATAVAVGERLIELAKISREGEASWLGLAWTNNRGWWLRPLDYDLYCGLPGIALCLAYLGEITGREDFTSLAGAAIATVERKLERNPRRVRYLGSYDGWGGLIHTWTHLATLWQRPDLLRAAEGMMPQLAAMIDDDIHLDVVRGSAGAIRPLLNLHRATGNDEALALARRLGDRLVEKAESFEGGKAWLMAASPSRPLTGFSHGAAGPAWALSELWSATGDERYRELALAAVAFENAYFSPERGNWPDLRLPPGAEKVRSLSYMHAWCHGACGIGLGRWRMLRHLDDPQLRRDAEAAVEVTVKNALGSNHCLCHGDLGALELALEAAMALPDSQWPGELQRSSALVLAGMDEHGFLCGIPLHVESPGLMDGLAGIGYTLLRLANPDRVPSILLLDPPV